MASESNLPVLEMKSISRRFPGVQALNGVDFRLFPGEVHAIMGQNGAGKSTLIKVLSGAHQPDAGGIFFEGEKVTLTPHLALALGIQTIYAVDEPDGLGPSWTGITGRITAELIQQKVPEYRQCLFYVSGPKGMVDSFKEILSQMNVPASQVKTDFFQGLA